MLTLKRLALMSFVGDVLTTVQVLKNKQILTTSSHLNFDNFSKHSIKTLNGCPMIITTCDEGKADMYLFSENLDGGYEDLF